MVFSVGLSIGLGNEARLGIIKELPLHSPAPDGDISPSSRTAITRFRIQVQGRSMSPLIEPGDRVLVERIPGYASRRGSLIVFKKKESLIVHRVIGKRRRNNGWLYCQKGDSGSDCSWIEGKDILGTVRSIEKKGRIVSLHQPKALILGYVVSGLGRVGLGLDFILSPLSEKLREGESGSTSNRPRRAIIYALQGSVRVMYKIFPGFGR